MDTMNAWLTGPKWTDKQIFGKQDDQVLVDEDRRAYQLLADEETLERRLALEDRMATYGVF
eukprot:16442205-Heterocapsa_arctica.AAC.1